MYRIFLLSVLIFYFVNAQTLTDILKKADENSPYLKAALFKSKSVEGQKVQAKASFNPQINVEFGRIISQTESGLNLTGFSLQQQLRLWGEKKHAVKSADLKQKAQKYFYQFQKNILYGQIYVAFYNSLYYRELLKLKKQEYKINKEIVNFLEKSFKLGETTQLDLLRAKRLLDITQIQINNLKAKYKASLNSLTALVGVEIKDVEGDFYIPHPIKDTDIFKHPLILYYDLIVESINEEIKRYKALAKPRISVGFVASEDEVDLGKYDFGFSINSTLPVFYKNEGQILSAVYRKKASLQEKNQQILKIKSDLESIKQQHSILISQIKQLEQETIPEVLASLKLAKKSFQNNVISFFEYSSINKQYFETVQFKLQLLNELHLLEGEYIKIGGFNQ